MELVRNFKGLTKSDANLAGGKGASLGEMTKAGIPVPPGFVVLAQTFERFIHETELDVEIDAIFHTVDHKDIHTVEAASEKIKFLIISAPMPNDIEKAILSSFDDLGSEYVAVRSSATAEDGAEHAWAGQLDSYLNTTRENVAEKVKQCWASLFTPRAIFYRFEKYGAATHVTKISVAVVVQKMVESEVSGIAFSVHPVTEDRNQLIIEAGFGLGEAIVSGQITPDSYVVEKNPRRVIDVCVNSQSRGLYRVAGGGNEWRELGEKGDTQVLNGKQIEELATIIIRIEDHYGFPCDIEWAFEKGRFYIVQSRPITTLSQKINPSDVSAYQFKTPELNGFDPDGYVFHGLWKNDLFATTFWQDSFVPELVKEMGIKADGIWSINLCGGHYFMKKSERDNIFNQITEKIRNKDEGFFKHIVKVADEVFDEGVRTGKKLRDMEPTLENFRKFVLMAKKINLLWSYGATHFVDSAEYMLLQSVVAEKFPAEHVLDIVPKVITPLYHRQHELEELKEKIGNRNLEEIKKDKKLWKLFTEQVEKYKWLEVFNFIGEPLSPERLYEQIEHMHSAPEPARYVPSKPLSAEIAFRAKCLNYCGYIKQAATEYFSIYSELVQPFLKRVAQKLGFQYGEMMLCYADEIDKALAGKLDIAELKKKFPSRKGHKKWMLFEKEAGNVILIEEPSDVDYLKDKMVPKADKNSNELQGQVGNPGKFTGPARIIMNTYDFSKMKKGDVLVSTMTTPDFMILMQQAGAIVTDIGGMLCHAAIVSREINKPCVIGTRFATHILKDGDMVEVDAEKGVVRIIK